MEESKVTRRVVEEVDKKNRSKVIEFEKPINDGGLGYGRCDIYIQEDNVAIECKGDIRHGGLVKGVGQALAYKTGRTHSFLIVPLSEITAELVNMCSLANVGLVGMDPVEGYRIYVSDMTSSWSLSKDNTTVYEKRGARDRKTKKLVVGLDREGESNWRKEI